MTITEAAEKLAPLFVKHGYAFLYVFRRGQGLSADQAPFMQDLLQREEAARGKEAHQHFQDTVLTPNHLEDMQVRNRSPLTQRDYLYAVARFAQYCGKSPDQLGAEEIRLYQLHLISRKMAWSSLRVIVCALRFLYCVTLGQDWAVQQLPYPRPERKLPIVLSLAEVQQFLEAIPNLKLTKWDSRLAVANETAVYTAVAQNPS